MNRFAAWLLLFAPLLPLAARPPMAFEANVGQADSNVQFLARGKGYTLLLTSSEAVFRFHGKRPLRMALVGAKAGPGPRGQVDLPSKSNYFLGNRLWRTGIATYARVLYPGVYPGIDLVYFGDSSGLEYDFIVAPGANANRIMLQFKGADALEIGNQGELVVRSGSDRARWRRPHLYQMVAGRRRTIDGGYRIQAKNQAGFRVGRYDRNLPLVIDPVLVYSTYLGGSGEENSTGNSSDARKSALAVDAAGNTYITGNTESTGFPLSGAMQGSNRGGADAFVVKLNPAGAVVFSTYLGGSRTDRGYGIAVDATGIYVTGRTQSPDFPAVGALQPALRGGEDAFVTKLTLDGASLVYSTFLGGSAQDDGHAIAVDGSGNALVAGGTESLDFPIASAYQSTHRGGQVDAFLTKLNPQGNASVFSTYLGGSGFDHAESVAVDPAAGAYVAGYSTSTSFPTASPFQSALRGPADGFVTRFDPQGRAVYSTYLGGSGPDLIHAVAVDAGGAAFVCGATASTDLPVTPGAFQERFAGNVDGFVARFNPEGSSLVYATYLGGGSDTAEDMALSLAVDAAGSAYVTGTTTSSVDFPVVEAFQRRMGGYRDAFVTALSPNGTSAVYSSFFGGSGLDYGYGIALSPAGDASITGRTFSEDLPVPSAVQPDLGGLGDAFLARIAARAPAGLFRAVPAASFRPGGPLAPESIASAFGTDLAPAVEVAQTTPLPTTLAGTQVRIRDFAGAERLAPLFFVAPSQVNFLVSAGTAPGVATLTVLRGGLTAATTEVRIEAVSPGLFTANADGQGAPAAIATRIAPNGTQTTQFVFQCGAAPGSCTPSPIDLGSPGDQVVLTLFGTGIRSRTSLQSVQASIVGPPLEVLFAGPQGEYVGLDQVNVRLPAEPIVRGLQQLRLVIDGRPANPVTIHLK